MAVASTILGVVLLALMVWDVYDQLFHHQGNGAMSRWIVSRAWALGSRFGPRALVYAGPISILLVLPMWLILGILGWTFLLLPHVPEGLTYGPGVPERGAFVDSFYAASVGISTLGYGDLVPKTTALRMIMPVEALMGFGLVTAGLSWVLATYPPLLRRRAIGRSLYVVLQSEEVDPRWSVPIARDLTAVTADLEQFPTSYYFRTADSERSLASLAIQLHDRIEEVRTDDSRELSSGWEPVRVALDGLANVIASNFIRDAPSATGDRLRAYAMHHLHDPEVSR